MLAGQLEPGVACGGGVLGKLSHCFYQGGCPLVPDQGNLIGRLALGQSCDNLRGHVYPPAAVAVAALRLDDRMGEQGRSGRGWRQGVGELQVCSAGLDLPYVITAVSRRRACGDDRSAAAG